MNGTILTSESLPHLQNSLKYDREISACVKITRASHRVRGHQALSCNVSYFRPRSPHDGITPQARFLERGINMAEDADMNDDSYEAHEPLNEHKILNERELDEK